MLNIVGTPEKQALATAAGAATDAGDVSVLLGIPVVSSGGARCVMNFVAVFSAVRPAPVRSTVPGFFRTAAFLPGHGSHPVLSSLPVPGELFLPAAAGAGRAPLGGAAADAAVTGTLAGHPVADLLRVHGERGKGKTREQQVECRHEQCGK